MTLNDLCAQLLPPNDHLHVDTLIIEEQRITVVGAMTAPKATCPDCGQPAIRIHSGYQRTLADLPWATMTIQHPPSPRERSSFLRSRSGRTVLRGWDAKSLILRMAGPPPGCTFPPQFAHG